MTSTAVPKTPSASGRGRSCRPTQRFPFAVGAGLFCVAAAIAGCGSDEKSDGRSDDTELIAEGRQTFRFDTFGDETKWTDQLRMNEVVATVDPTTALTVGLKVDSEALPANVVAASRTGPSA